MNHDAARAPLTAAAALALSILAGCTHAAPLPPRAIALNRDGAAALAAGDLVTAEARVGVALEYNPRFTEAWVNLGLVELKRGNFALAKKHLKRARDLNPDLPAPHHALGMLADAEGKNAEAEARYRDALKVDPGFVPARVNLVRKLFERGAFDEAREQCLRLIEVDPAVIEAHVALVESLLRLGRDEEADDALDRASERFTGRAPIVLLQARRALRRSDLARAEEMLTALSRQTLEPEDASAAWAWLAVARLGRANADGAVMAANEALRIDEHDAVARYVLAQASRARR